MVATSSSSRRPSTSCLTTYEEAGHNAGGHPVATGGRGLGRRCCIMLTLRIKFSVFLSDGQTCRALERSSSAGYPDMEEFYRAGRLYRLT